MNADEKRAMTAIVSFWAWLQLLGRPARRARRAARGTHATMSRSGIELARVGLTADGLVGPDFDYV
jgi:hypothetical protein